MEGLRNIPDFCWLSMESNGTLLNVYGISAGISGSICGASIEYAWNMNGIKWNTYGMRWTPMEYNGVPVEQPMECNGLPMGYNAIPIENQWNTKEYVWNTNGIQWNPLWNPLAQFYRPVSWNMLVDGVTSFNSIDHSRGICQLMESLRSTLWTPLLEYASWRSPVTQLDWPLQWNMPAHWVPLLNSIDPSGGIR